eukprot:1160828-Pelagomonas_calceolata.AAC.11
MDLSSPQKALFPPVFTICFLSTCSAVPQIAFVSLLSTTLLFLFSCTATFCYVLMLCSCFAQQHEPTKLMFCCNHLQTYRSSKDPLFVALDERWDMRPQGPQL